MIHFILSLWAIEPYAMSLWEACEFKQNGQDKALVDEVQFTVLRY